MIILKKCPVCGNAVTESCYKCYSCNSRFIYKKGRLHTIIKAEENESKQRFEVIEDCPSCGAPIRKGQNECYHCEDEFTWINDENVFSFYQTSLDEQDQN